MSRIAQLFKTDGKKLVTYIVAGDPDLETSQEILNSLPDAGADLIELGMPFTDPVADGPVIQAGALRALAAGTTIKSILGMVANFRKTNDRTPVILMGYYNPLFSYGVDKFVRDAADAGVDGLLIVDLPPEEAEELSIPAKKAGLDFIALVTPTSDEARLPLILKNASGFIYYVAVAGITGGVSASADILRPRIELIRAQTSLPVCVGFGIKTAEDVKAISEIADGVVVGSAIVEKCATEQTDEIAAFIKSLNSRSN